MPNQAKQTKDEKKGNRTGRQVENKCFSTLSTYTKMDFNQIISTITFNVNEQTISIKIQRLSTWTKTKRKDKFLTKAFNLLHF